MAAFRQTLYKTSKLSLDFFVYAPTVSEYKDVYTIDINPILQLRQIPSGSLNEDSSTIKDRTYKITPRNFYKTIKFFNEIISWFYDDNKNDLFLVSEETDELIFNADYNDLSLVTERSGFDTSIMKAVPAIITYNDNRHEGIYLYINKMNNVIILSLRELETLFGILKGFSFYETTNLVLNSALYANINKTVVSNYNKPKTPFD